MQPSPDDIAACVLSTFESLPKKRKPVERDSTQREWVPLSGIVLSRPQIASKPLQCLSLGTGMKCLPREKVPLANGVVLHDWHAEVLAMRAFNRYLLDTAAELAKAKSKPALKAEEEEEEENTILRWRDESEKSEGQEQPFAIKDDVQLHMYCSEAPCGDASMELIMQAQEDATPWAVPESTPNDPSSSSSANEELRGRGYFSELGIVRRKPARSDAPPTLSKSCTDKITLKQCTSLLSRLSTILIHPSNAYLKSLILPSSQLIPSAISRAFGPNGRMKELTQSHSQTQTSSSSPSNIATSPSPNPTHGYAYNPFHTLPASREFPHSRRYLTHHYPGQKKPVASNLSAVYTPHHQETLINGSLQGRKQFDPRGGSVVCRRRMWGVLWEVVEVLGVLGVNGFGRRIGGIKRYEELKGMDGVMRGREEVKQFVRGKALKGWVKNEGDNFEL